MKHKHLKFNRVTHIRHYAKKRFLLYISTFLLSAWLIFFSESCTAQNFRFGVIADVQYADKENAIGRHYRTSLQKLDEAVSELNRHSPDFVLQLGDVIDGHSNDQEGSNVDLNRVLNKLNRLSMPVYHVVGNHCLSAGQEALKENEKVFVFSHFAVHPEAAKRHRMRETGKLFELIHQNNVLAWFSGHDHAGGYAYDNGIHHVTFNGMVESPVNNAYALVEFHEDVVRLIGFGDQPSHDLVLEQK